MTSTHSRRPDVTRVDRYPSRQAAHPTITDRLDPVLWGTGSGPLHADQVAGYERDGFIQIPSLLDPNEVAALDAEVLRLADDPTVQADERTIIEPNSGAVRSVFEVHHDGPFAALCRDDRLAGAARQLLGSDVSLHQSRVTDNTHVNGPLMVIAGSHRFFVSCVGETPRDNHRSSLRRQEIGVPDDDSLTALAVRSKIVDLTGPAGSATFFECNLMYGSNGNITPLPRRNAFFVFNSAENAIGEPFAAPAPRPNHIANRDATPLSR